MLRAYALADLFEANRDSTVPYVFLGTTGGNLIGACSNMPAPLVKRLSVLGALTWRFHATTRRQEVGRRVTLRIEMNGNAQLADSQLHPGRPAALPVLKKGRNSEDDALRELVVECDGRVCAFEYVKEGLLVGAVSGELTTRKEDRASESTSRSIEGSSEIEDGASTEPRAHAGNETANESDETRSKERLVRLLGVKASAMSDHLREELKDFRMPRGIE